VLQETLNPGSFELAHEDRRVRYETTELDGIVLAYAVSVH
jgi:hypothetical protein